MDVENETKINHRAANGIILLTNKIWRAIVFRKLIMKTVEAEITVRMFPQRACVAGSQAENSSSNGPPRAQSKAGWPSILRRVGIRQLPGIC